jgi:hypothetical protein
MTECRIGSSLYLVCDEYKLVQGNTYLVHTDRTGYFLGTFMRSLRLYSSEYVFRNCTFYKPTHFKVLVPCAFQTEVVADLFYMTAREYKGMDTIEE